MSRPCEKCWDRGHDECAATCIYSRHRKAKARSEALESLAVELVGALVDAANYDADDGPCWGMAPCCIADYGPGSRDRCDSKRAVLSRAASLGIQPKKTEGA